jgi:hypothetical protein
MNPAGTTVNTKNDRILRTSVAIKADAASGNSVEIEVLQAGVWRTLYHGDFMITPDDLQAYVDNFVAGVGLPGNGKDGAPIDYKHESWDKAAGWMTNLRVSEDSLIATVTWTPAARQAILDGEYKYFSPEFYPVGRGGWCDSEDPDVVVNNVLVGGGLTNIPLFKDLSGLKASADGAKHMIFIADKPVTANNKENPMDLATVRGKKQTELTDAEKAFINEHKDELNDTEKKEFGIEVAANPAQVDDPAADPNKDPKKEGDEVEVTDKQEAAVAASLKKKGYAVVKADRLERLENTATSYEKEKAEAIVKAHAARGAIKADQIPAWTDRLVKADATTRADLEEALNGLNDNPVMASAQGGNENKSGDATDIVGELDKKTKERVAASATAGKHLTYGQAQAELLREDKDLNDRVEAARKQ